MNYSLKQSIVSNSEAEALKEMIFKRARERALALNKESQENSTQEVRTDIMNMARESFISEKNPFSQNIVKEPEDKPNNNEIGFAKRQVKEIKLQVNNKNNIINSDLTFKEIESTMQEARENLFNKKSFVGALDFLNSQATISLVKNKGYKFEALA